MSGTKHTGRRKVGLNFQGSRYIANSSIAEAGEYHVQKPLFIADGRRYHQNELARGVGPSGHGRGFAGGVSGLLLSLIHI